MKQSVLVLHIILLFFISSCATQQQMASNDDVYADPKADRMEAARIAAQKKASRDAYEKRYNDSIVAVNQAQKEKDDANPYYKDREFKYDDYYDYEYATRIKRFDNSINGLSYYDNYYTNSYWYNRNPYNYGVSVYNGYSWWGSNYNYYSYNPSISFYTNYGWGNNYGWGGYNGYNPYDPYGSAYWQGYNNGYFNGYNNGWGGYPYHGFGYGYGYNPYGGYGYGYNPYGYGYGYNPYYGGYGYSYPYNGWGYYNGYDVNSSYTYGPRASHTGNNSPRTSNPGMRPDEGYVQKYVSSVAQQQATLPKFVDQPVRSNPTKTGLYNNNGSVGVKNQQGGTHNPVRTNGTATDQPIRDKNTNTGINPGRNNGGNTETTSPVKQPNQPIRNYDNQPVKQQYENQPVRQYEQQPVKQQYESQPVRQFEKPVKQYEAPARDNFQQPSSSPSNNGGGGGGGVRSGGGGRPR